MPTETKYPSAVSYGLVIPVSAVLLIAVITTIIGGELVPMIIIGIVIFAVVLPIFLNTNYTIDSGTLRVRSGWVVKIDIPITAIKEIRATSSILSSPALSVTERIQITYGKFDDVVISPADRQTFIAELLRINPAISVAAGV